MQSTTCKWNVLNVTYQAEWLQFHPTLEFSETRLIIKWKSLNQWLKWNQMGRFDKRLVLIVSKDRIDHRCTTNRQASPKHKKRAEFIFLCLLALLLCAVGKHITPQKCLDNLDPVVLTVARHWHTNYRCFEMELHHNRKLLLELFLCDVAGTLRLFANRTAQNIFVRILHPNRIFFCTFRTKPRCTSQIFFLIFKLLAKFQTYSKEVCVIMILLFDLVSNPPYGYSWLCLASFDKIIPIQASNHNVSITHKNLNCNANSNSDLHQEDNTANSTRNRNILAIFYLWPIQQVTLVFKRTKLLQLTYNTWS